MESSCTICGKFFQNIIGEETIEKIVYMRFEHEFFLQDDVNRRDQSMTS
jgi:hypothetical protein